MLSNNSAFFKKGIRSWLSMRISSLIITIYVFYILSFIFFSYGFNYYNWCNFFKDYSNKFFTVLALFSIIIHSWIGMWQIITDYLKNIFFSLFIRLIVAITLIFYFIYGITLIFRI